ncbi:hypothetical protein F8388_001052 [Cannabis sativa]|uniref:ABC-type xenobiotic transporter n=1 Tax=Cannabis sativa TaxID=3483 RepID=A0A7J6FDB9_CANSA|nr:hypothetical protein F8388_001052 [Cannabis sativa]
MGPEKHTSMELLGERMEAFRSEIQKEISDVRSQLEKEVSETRAEIQRLPEIMMAQLTRFFAGGKEKTETNTASNKIRPRTVHGDGSLYSTPTEPEVRFPPLMMATAVDEFQPQSVNRDTSSSSINSKLLSEKGVEIRFSHQVILATKLASPETKIELPRLEMTSVLETIPVLYKEKPSQNIPPKIRQAWQGKATRLERHLLPMAMEAHKLFDRGKHNQQAFDAVNDRTTTNSNVDFGSSTLPALHHEMGGSPVSEKTCASPENFCWQSSTEEPDKSLSLVCFDFVSGNGGLRSFVTEMFAFGLLKPYLRPKSTQGDDPFYAFGHWVIWDPSKKEGPLNITQVPIIQSGQLFMVWDPGSSTSPPLGYYKKEVRLVHYTAVSVTEKKRENPSSPSLNNTIWVIRYCIRLMANTFAAFMFSNWIGNMGEDIWNCLIMSSIRQKRQNKFLFSNYGVPCALTTKIYGITKENTPSGIIYVFPQVVFQEPLTLDASQVLILAHNGLGYENRVFGFYLLAMYLRFKDLVCWKRLVNGFIVSVHKTIRDCLMGMLREKTVLFVTHQVEFLPAADHILVMQNGKIAQAGTFEKLMNESIGFEILVGAHSKALESMLTFENTSKEQKISEIESTAASSTTNSEVLPARHESDHDISLDIATEKKGAKLVQDEEREKGSIGKEVYWNYLTTVNGGLLVPFIILAQSSFQVLQIASNYWMAWSCPPTTGSQPKMEINFILLVYVLLAVGGSLCVLLRAMLVGIAGLWTAQKLFINMLRSVFRAPMSFFDSTPTGRTLSRASTDQSVLDLEMPQRLGWCAFSIIQLLGTIAVMSQVAWEVFVIFIPVTAVCIWYQRYYIPTARELARLEGIQRTPILHHFAESLSGSATIRAFQQEDRFIQLNLCLIDNHSTPWFHNVAAMEWLSFRLNMLSNFVFAFSLVLLVTLPEGVINPSIAGLAVTYGINLNVLQASVIWNICNAENKMISVERIIQYSNIQSEAPLLIEDCKLPNNWPQDGTICFRNLEIRYAEHLPSVLNNINCTFPGKMKIGVVGRTGSGKSTLIQAIFRIVEPREGSIIIDDVDICKIGLHHLRSRLSIIPQDPTMFQGTVRGNLDPLGQYTDSEAWEALEKCQLASIVREKEKKLDAIVVENGENWSMGQRQLFCLGRALLKKSTILVLDEATASVDSATDGIIQRIISKEFKDRTVVTIAHRIHTVVESDLVLVLSDGRVAEYDTPARLLERDDSFFSKLVKEYSMRSKSFNNLTNYN